MSAERGQATIEWIGLLLLVALVLAALSKLAPSADGRELGTTIAHSITAAAKQSGRPLQTPAATTRPAPSVTGGAPSATGGAPSATGGAPSATGSAPSATGSAPVGHRSGMFMPRLLPHAGPALPGRRPALRALGGRPNPRLPELPSSLRRAGRGAGALWRRAWFACLAYERTRYAILHPESRLPGYTFPVDVALRMANNCISPVDLFRDWPLLDGDQ